MHILGYSPRYHKIYIHSRPSWICSYGMAAGDSLALCCELDLALVSLLELVCGPEFMFIPTCKSEDTSKVDDVGRHQCSYSWVKCHFL